METKIELLGISPMVFFLSKEILYKRTLSMYLFRCVNTFEVEKILNKFYLGIYGLHSNGYVLEKNYLGKILWVDCGTKLFLLCMQMSSMPNSKSLDSLSFLRVGPHVNALALHFLGHRCHSAN